VSVDLIRSARCRALWQRLFALINKNRQTVLLVPSCSKLNVLVLFDVTDLHYIVLVFCSYSAQLA